MNGRFIMFRVWGTSCVLFFLNLHGCNLTSSHKGKQVIYLRMTTPLRRELAETYLSSSSEEQHESVESSYPQREPPQSSLTRSPERVMPYRSQEQLKDEAE